MRNYLLIALVQSIVSDKLESSKDDFFSRSIINAGVIIGIGFGVGYILISRDHKGDQSIISQKDFRKVEARFNKIHNTQRKQCVLKDEQARRTFLFEKSKDLICGDITESWLRKEVALRANNHIVHMHSGTRYLAENGSKQKESFYQRLFPALVEADKKFAIYRTLPLYKKQWIYFKLLIDRLGVDYAILNLEPILSHIKTRIISDHCSNYGLKGCVAIRLSNVIWQVINEVRLYDDSSQGSFVDLVKKRLFHYLGAEYMEMYKKQIDALLPDYEDLLRDSIFILQEKKIFAENSQEEKIFVENLEKEFLSIKDSCTQAFLEYVKPDSLYRARKENQILNADVFLYQKQCFIRIYLYSKLTADVVAKHFEFLEDQIKIKSIDSIYINEFSFSDSSSLNINTVMNDMIQIPPLEVLTHEFSGLSGDHEKCFCNFIDEVVYYGMSRFFVTDPDFILKK